MDTERISFLALHFVPGVGNFLIRQLLSYCGSAEQVFKQPRQKLLKIPGVGTVTAEAIRHGRLLARAEGEFERAAREQTEILFFTDKGYPPRLRNIDDAPPVIYIKGNININKLKSVAIVGTREATSYGRHQVEKIIEELVPHEALIVSGLAYGIDIHAHKEALRHGLLTIGVLGSGIDVIYPYIHRDTAAKMVNQGGLVTEKPFGTSPDARHFPARNRIIAGLCDALIVVEAAHKGGALITAEIANSYNRDVFAVPGNLGHTFSEGCNKLIKINKANLFTSVRDLEYIMNWSSAAETKKDMQLSLDLTPFDGQEQVIMKILHQRNLPMMIDELSMKSGMELGILSSLLLSLEFKNAVVSLPGKMYRVR